MSNLSELEKSILLVCFASSDQFGNVDILKVVKTLAPFNIILDEKLLKVEQYHIDILMDHKIIPDTRSIINKMMGKK